MYVTPKKNLTPIALRSSQKSLSWKQDSARFQEFKNVGTFGFCCPTGLKFIKKTEGKAKETTRKYDTSFKEFLCL
jgi:hypothetical protein